LSGSSATHRNNKNDFACVSEDSVASLGKPDRETTADGFAGTKAKRTIQLLNHMAISKGVASLFAF
jgi:hypothetical protein